MDGVVNVLHRVRSWRMLYRRRVSPLICCMSPLCPQLGGLAWAAAVSRCALLTHGAR